MIKKSDLELYFNDMMDLNPSSAYYLGIKNIKTLSTIENVFDCNYLIAYNKIINKYKHTKDNILKIIISNAIKFSKYDFSYMPINSFGNIILNFDNIKYPKNKTHKLMRLKDFNNFINSCIDKMKQGIKKKIVLPKMICSKLIKQFKNTKYQKLYLFLKNEYYKNCRNTLGLSYLKNGKKIYKLLIKNTCGFYISPEKIHKYGKKLVKKYKINNNSIELYKTPSELYKDCIKYYNIIYKTILPKYFNYIPTKKCKILPVPKLLENVMGLAYFNNIKNTFFINLSKYKEINKNSLKILVMHETDPGHHYHFNYFHHKNLPYYKIYSFNNNALIEGWALYSEKLDGVSKGTDEMQQLRSIRLVVDTGINYYGWSYKKSFDYMKKNLNILSDDEINEEIERYICIPSQALSYQLGNKYILYLRYLYIYKYKLGNIKNFHNFMLEDGIVPFKYLKNKIDLLFKNK